MSGPSVSRWVIGFSGGLDSTVLLHLISQWQPVYSPSTSVMAIHINHQLQSESNEWQRHCESLCQQWGISLHCETITVDQSAASLEQAARIARRRVFQQCLKSSDGLMLAHHRDDQVETLLQRLVRGSGPLGLGAMLPFSMQEGMALYRPLLGWDRQQLKKYALYHDLNWIEDQSNQDERFQRNFLRHTILPLWRQRQPGLNQTMSRSAQLCQESAELLDDLARIDCLEKGITIIREDGGLPIATIIQLSVARQRNVLRYWLRQQGASVPSEVNLQRLLQEVMLASLDAQPQVQWADMSVRRYRGTLYVVRDAVVDDDARQNEPQKCKEITVSDWLAWIDQGQLLVGSGQLLISKQAVPGGFSKVKLSKRPLQVRSRLSGEICRPVGRPAKTLKALFQEAAIPPWLRAQWPVLYCGDDIAGLPGICVCEGYQADAAESGYQIVWQWQGSKDLQPD